MSMSSWLTDISIRSSMKISSSLWMVARSWDRRSSMHRAFSGTLISSILAISWAIAFSLSPSRGSVLTASKSRAVL